MKNALETAQDLGLRLPAYDQAAAPELFQAWADRVAWVESLTASGRDATEATAEARRYDGHQAEPTPYPAPLPGPILH